MNSARQKTQDGCWMVWHVLTKALQAEDWPTTYMHISLSVRMCVIGGELLPIVASRGQSLCEIKHSLSNIQTRHAQPHTLAVCYQMLMIRIWSLPSYPKTYKCFFHLNSRFFWCVCVAADKRSRRVQCVLSISLFSSLERVPTALKMLWTGETIFNIQHPSQMFHLCLMIKYSTSFSELPHPEIDINITE